MSTQDHPRATSARMAKAAQSPRSKLFGIANACQIKIHRRGQCLHQICQPKGGRRRAISTAVFLSALRNSRRSSAYWATSSYISSTPNSVSSSGLPVNAA